MKWLLSIIFIVIAHIASAQNERRFTIWNKNEVAISPWKNVTIEVGEKIHYTPKNNSLDVKFGEVFLSHEPKKWLEYGGGFRVGYANLGKGNWLQEQRSMFLLNFTANIKQFELSFSNRMEYRAYKNLDDHFRYKQSLKLSSPVLTNYGTSIYISEESFYKMNGIGTHLARLQTGVTAVELEHFDIKVYYILEKFKIASTWFTADVVGVNLGFSI
jgi:hypothetical protein